MSSLLTDLCQKLQVHLSCQINKGSSVAFSVTKIAATNSKPYSQTRRIYNGLYYGRYMRHTLCILTVQWGKHTWSLVACDRWSLYMSVINAKTFGTSTTWTFKTSGCCIEVVTNTGVSVYSNSEHGIQSISNNRHYK